MSVNQNGDHQQYLMHINRRKDIRETFNTAIINMVHVPKTVMLQRPNRFMEETQRRRNHSDYSLSALLPLSPPAQHS